MSNVRLPHIATLLELFASRPDATVDELREDYRNYAAWVDECKRLGPDAPHPAAPNVAAGDAFWFRQFGCAPNQPRVQPSRPDLRDLAITVTSRIAPGLSQELLTSHRGGKTVVAVRQSIVDRAFAAGYRGVDIARYLNISEAAVSSIGARIRARRHPIPELANMSGSAAS